MTLAEKIKTARADADLSQAQLAIRIGVTKRAVSFWERGDRVPGFYHLARISAATGRPLAWFADEVTA